MTAPNLNRPAIDPGPLTAADLPAHIAAARRQQHPMLPDSAFDDWPEPHMQPAEAATELGVDDDDPARLFIGAGVAAVLSLIAVAVGAAAAQVWGWL